jgi:8-oxo-dGTP pyrophosphatase MutT (NUDIX family)
LARRFGDDGAVSVVSDSSIEIPRIPASVGALIFDPAGRLLVLKPNYKKGWTIPGGQIDSNGESPWGACKRETHEECGLELESGWLVCVDFRRPKPDRPGGVRFLFDCGAFTDRQLSTIRLQPSEIDDYRFADLAEAMALLRAPIRRRVAAAVDAERCVYLEDGRPVAAVRDRRRR